ncbi:MAG: GNAT family N-acetyltransferase [Roseateles sp.]|nr:MAG: GNAT family N-acetyltransferase [Roseateles sp.]
MAGWWASTTSRPPCRARAMANACAARCWPSPTPRAPAYAALVGALRGSTVTAIAAHAERIDSAPVRYQGFALRDEAGTLLACGQMVVAGGLVGLYDIASAVPRQGHGERLCRALLALAHAQGARQAYLQVGSDNAVAQRLYARLGFRFAYRYHYRSPEAELT